MPLSEETVGGIISLQLFPGQTITRDGVGNPLSDGTWTYTWEHGRQLKSMTDGEETWTYQYNADGLRTHRYSADTSYYYSYVGDRLGYYSTDDAYFSIAYDATGMPYSLCRNGVEYYYYVLNLQGDVIAINDDEGNTVVYYVYDAWGNPVSMTDDSGCGIGTANVLRYRGYVYDHETGLYYLQSRYYNPQLGRFINADTYAATGQGVLGYNVFSYCLNNPGNLIDPSGHIPFSDHHYTDAFVALGEKIGRWLRDRRDKKREEAKKVPYQSNGAGNGAQIPNSYTIKSPVIMYEYIEEHRGDEIAGSTTGVVFEWVVHNVAYEIGEAISSVGFTDLGQTLKTKGRDLDIGRTIYDDSHGAFSKVMWAFYERISPITAAYDVIVKLFE